MNSEPSSRSGTSQHRDDRPPIATYPLVPATIALWLRRGQRMGQLARDLATASSALLARASRLLRQITTRPPANSPPTAG